MIVATLVQPDHVWLNSWFFWLMVGGIIVFTVVVLFFVYQSGSWSAEDVEEGVKDDRGRSKPR
ncbi:MAG TPA: hypothetical protein VLL52_13310 [Anaerolineae bacterium]|nr:hypothetical protein [Anaerolineae bacterium]